MHLQGDLQLLFDALYQMGVIEPLLKSDWTERYNEDRREDPHFQKVVRTANEANGSVPKLINRLAEFDQETLEFLAMEVAREFADYSTRNTVQ